MSVSVTRVPYAGLATRALALAVDVAIINVIVFACAAVLGLVGSLVGDLQLDTFGRLLAAAAWGLAVGAYFVFFWSIARPDARDADDGHPRAQGRQRRTRRRCGARSCG